MTILNKAIKGNLLFWRIALVFTGLLILLGIVFIIIASRFSESYYNTAHQELYGNIAQHLATFTQPFKNGKPDTTVTHDIIHSTMVANPSVEVYLLDTAGNIVDYVVPDTTVHVNKVDISKVKQWLAAKEINRPMGDNPKAPGEPSIFSAAPAYENGKLSGYVYAVLSSEKQKQILHSISNRFYFRLGSYIFFSALAVAFLVGLFTFFSITRSVSNITAVVMRFKEGDYTARIEGHSKGDMAMLSTTFNEMADVIVGNFEKIAATDRFRQELIANISHDLRTPLSAMQGYVETLMMKAKELPDEEKMKYLLIVHESTRRLGGLVEQLFQYAKLEANIVIPEKESFLINELASDILMTYQLKAAERNIQLEIKAPSRLSPVFGDIALTERVFQNLLDNAFKFTPHGGNITIELAQTVSGVSVKIVDTGAGIPFEDQPYIFERYKQLNKERNNTSGMGIGLAIVRKILELHQTTIQIFSEPGKGTAFQFTLPLRNNFILQGNS